MNFTVLPSKLLILDGGFRKWGQPEVDHLKQFSKPQKPATINAKYVIFGHSLSDGPKVELASLLRFNSGFEFYEELSHPDIVDTISYSQMVCISRDSVVLGGGLVDFTLSNRTTGAPSLRFHGLSDTYGSPSATLLRSCVADPALLDTLSDLVVYLGSSPSIVSHSSDSFVGGFNLAMEKNASAFYKKLDL